IGQPFDRQIALALLLLEELSLGLLHAGQDGSLSPLVLIDSDAEIDLLRIGVLLEGLSESENRVGRSQRQSVEHGAVGCMSEAKSRREIQQQKELLAGAFRGAHAPYRGQNPRGWTAGEKKFILASQFLCRKAPPVCTGSGGVSRQRFSISLQQGAKLL